MPDTACESCGGSIRAGDETCPQCGALTAWGKYREVHHARRAEGGGNRLIYVLIAALGMLISLILLVLGLLPNS